jgi:hypothetical protein
LRKFEKSKGQFISDYKTVKVKRMNHIIEVLAVDKASNGFSKIEKLSKTHYIVKDTGEVLEYKLSENRSQNESSLRRTFKKIRDLINNNFTGQGNEIHLTLTYKLNMTDSKKLYDDFRIFWQKFKRRYGSDYDYLSVVEPQGRGAWHCHVLIRANKLVKLFIPHEEIASLWSHGFVKIKALDGVDNIGAYLSAYLTDVELTEETLPIAVLEQKEIKEVEVAGHTKRYIKGGRLHLYPPGMNLYRKSRGIVFPEVEQMKYGDIKKIVGTATPNYSMTVTIQEADKLLNRITYEHYNMRRPRKQINKDVVPGRLSPEACSRQE